MNAPVAPVTPASRDAPKAAQGPRYSIGTVISYYVKSKLLHARYWLEFRRRVRGLTCKNPVFIDCGANVGQGFKFFKTIFPPDRFRYILFEPNAACLDPLRQNISRSPFKIPAEIYNSAVWTENGTLKLYGLQETGDTYTQSASVRKEHNSGSYEADGRTATMVDAIDFASFLDDLQKDHDLIVVKMDIEGAELDVLEHLWRTPDRIRRHTIMFVEFHSRFQAPAQRDIDERRETSIRSNAPANVELRIWH